MMTGKRVVKFDRLPAPVRARFTAAVASSPEAPQSPIAQDTVGRWRARITLVVLCLLEAALVWLLVQTRDMANAQTWLIYVALWVPALLVLATIASRLSKSNPFPSLPFAPGQYLFALDHVDVRGSSLVIRPLSEGSLDCVHRHINGRYITSSIRVVFRDGMESAFVFSDRAMAEWALGKMQGVQSTLRSAAARGDVSTLMALDPFFELGRA
jgi:hypothetical protein